MQRLANIDTMFRVIGLHKLRWHVGSPECYIGDGAQMCHISYSSANVDGQAQQHGKKTLFLFVVCNGQRRVGSLDVLRQEAPLLVLEELEDWVSCSPNATRVRTARPGLRSQGVIVRAEVAARNCGSCAESAKLPSKLQDILQL